MRRGEDDQRYYRLLTIEKGGLFRLKCEILMSHFSCKLLGSTMSKMFFVILSAGLAPVRLLSRPLSARFPNSSLLSPSLNEFANFLYFFKGLSNEECLFYTLRVICHNTLTLFNLTISLEISD